MSVLTPDSSFTGRREPDSDTDEQAVIRFDWQEDRLFIDCSQAGEVSLTESEVMDLIANIAGRSTHTIDMRTAGARTVQGLAPDVEEATRPAPTPGSVARTVSKQLEAAGSGSQVNIIPTASEFAERLGFDQEDIAGALAEPEVRWTTHRGNADVLTRGDLGLLVGHADECVLAVFPAFEAEARYGSATSWGTSLKAKSSNRHVFPSTPKELVDLAIAAGLTCELTGKNHWSISRGTKAVTIAGTPSDYRSMKNATMQVKNVLGVDLRTKAGQSHGEDRKEE